MSSRRQARRAAVAPAFTGSDDPNRVVQQTLDSRHGQVRGWFLGGACKRVWAPGGQMYGWEEAPAVWAAVLGGSFRPNDYGKRNRR
jgi:hypothetical protein